MNELQKRMVLYGAAAVALGGMGVAVMASVSEADAITLLSSVDVQLRLAHGIPAVDKLGHPLATRQRMIDEAVVNLAIIERQKPGMAIAAEFRGFAHMLDGQFQAAAACYGRARECLDCADEQRDVLAFNQARMLWKAGDAAGALRIFENNAAALDARFGHQRRIEQAEILARLGRTGEAVAGLETVLADAAAEPMAWVQTGCELDRLDCLERAEAAFEMAVAHAPIANYFLARLKLRQGEVDNAYECLERAFAAAPADTRRLVREEPEAWQALAEDERFMQLAKPVAATPNR